MKNKTSLYFLIFALTSLLLGVLFGLLSSLQYVLPSFLKEYIPFSKMRPFHVTSVVSWIVLAATGCIYFFLTRIEKFKLYSPRLAKIHLVIFFLTGIGIYTSFFTNKMEGREYLAFATILIFPILLGWILFGVNYFKTLYKNASNWPVYYWMWGTGIVFMIYHLCEAHLWFFDYFKEYFVRDMAVQWKSYGSFTGSWNLLVYGISMYVMTKIKGDVSFAKSKMAFFFYFLGLTNLMFGWAHHTYLLPTYPWIRFVAYGISMTEWIVLGTIIYNWKKSLGKTEKTNYPLVYRFLVATDIWILLNLILALLFSIPAINYFTHGTHITVAHSMGTTIGINTTILFAALLFIVSYIDKEFNKKQPLIKRGFVLFNISLFFFLVSLLIAGFKKSYWTYAVKDGVFSQLQDSLILVYSFFFVFGLGIVISLIMISIPILKRIIKSIKEE